MKVSTTAERLQTIIKERGLRQVDILEAAKPYCLQYEVKLEKNDLSQYISGKVEPGQHKLTVLALALDVDEVWLMGYDVPRNRSEKYENSIALSDHEKAVITAYRDKPGRQHAVDTLLGVCESDSTRTLYETKIAAFGGGMSTAHVTQEQLDRAAELLEEIQKEKK